MDEPFWGQDIAVVDVEWVGGDSAVLIKHCSSTGDLEWAQQVTADEARGVCWYLARLFGQELHPEGTATKLNCRNTEVAKAAVLADLVEDMVEDLDEERMPSGLTVTQVAGVILGLAGTGEECVQEAANADLIEEGPDGWFVRPRGKSVERAIRRLMGEPEPEPEPEEQWSEPVDGMTWERCATIIRSMGSTLRTQHAEKGWKAIAGDIYVPDGGYWETEDRASMAAVRWCADKADRYDRDTDRVRLDGLEVARG